MSRIHRVIALAVLITSGACHGKSPLAPTPGPPGVRAFLSLRIEGPATVTPGASAQFRLVRTYTDNTQEDATAQAVWSSSNYSILSIDGPGRVTGVARGEATLVANSGPSARLPVLVLEDGTFRLTGHVLEGALPLPDARVAVTQGTGAGLSAVTKSDGVFALYGVAGEIALRVEAAGYAQESRPLLVTANATTDVTLRPIAAPVDFSGAWRMTIAPSPACGALAQDVGGPRAFAAAITQDGPAVTVRLTSETLTTPAKLSGRVLDKTLMLDLTWEDDYYYRGNPIFAVLDALDPTHFLAMFGSLRVDAAASHGRGTLAGHLELWAGNTYFSSKLDRDCNAADHAVTLDR